MRGEILKIHDDYCFAQDTIIGMKKQIHIIFSNFSSYNSSIAPNIPTQCISNINRGTSVLCQAVNRAKLLLPSSDKKFKKVLKDFWRKYGEISNKINTYYNSGYAYSASETAWNTIAHYGIIRYDYYTLMNNRPTYEIFLKVCANDSTNEIEQRMMLLLYTNIGKNTISNCRNI